MGTILIVEDSETVRSELKIIVEGLDHTAILAANGAKGYEQWTNNEDICLILSDVYMPVMDGLEMCEQIYDNLGERKMPSILMITNETSLQDLQTKEIMKIFAQIEYKRREVEKRQRAQEQRERQQEEEEMQKEKNAMKFEKNWRQEGRVDKRVGNWRDFQQKKKPKSED